MNADGSNQSQLTTDGSQPELSHNGTQIAFVRAHHIWVMNADATNQHEVFAAALNTPHCSVHPDCDPYLQDPATVLDSTPTWSRDGSQIAFIRQPISLVASGLLVMNADGSGGHVIVDDHQESRISNLAWSPEGTKIAYSFLFHDGSTHIDLANADGSGATCCLTGEHPPFNSARDREPGWSPDGSKVAYFGNEALGTPGMWVINADGSNATQLTPSADHDPTFSPDGSHLAFSRGGHIWTMSAVANDPGVDLGVAGGDPSWGPRT
jgi:dipeptidyl aminopeptidase/acylaminoacyl peptidase